MAVVLITGCSSGFGRAAAEGFAARGDQVVATMRNPERALAPDGTAAGLDEVRGVVIDRLDVVDPDSRAGAVERTLTRFGRIDVLINNAGISALGATEEMPDEVFRHQFETNFFGPFALIKLVLPSMRDNDTGRIVNVTSGAVKAPIAGLDLSNGARCGLTGVVAGLARTTVARNVTINNLLPGTFKTRIPSRPISAA